VTVYLFIEAEKAGRRNVSRACALLKVSRAAFYQHLAGPSLRDQEDARPPGRSRPSMRSPRNVMGRPGCTRSCAAMAAGTAVSGWPG
jgi:hypothetical protein